jgi:pimeloyl-ACP methyl ester carboxylesterase
MSEPDGAVRWAYRTDAEDLVTDVYYGRQDPGYLDVFVAFEGTNWSQWGDVLSNAAWFTSFFARNEYDVARDVFVAIQAKAKAEAAAGETVRYVVLGHSLGGGLAQHVAFGFPCVTAVVLDASFVINRHSYRQAIADPEVIHLGDRGEIFTFLRERQGLEDPLSSVITLIGGPFDGFMPGDRTQFHTVNATDVKTGPADFWQLFAAQHSVEVFVGTANDMLIDRYWEGEPGYQPFRLRCLSRLNRPDRCSQAQYCSEKDKNKVLQSLTGYDFAGMCNGSLIPPSSP